MEKKPTNFKVLCVFVDAHGIFSNSTTSGLALHDVLLFYTIKEIHIIQWYQQVSLCECQYLSHT